MAKKRTWDGGYIIKDVRRRDVFYIRKQINGKRYDLSTRCHSVTAAVEQLKRFEADPEAFTASGTVTQAAVRLDKELAVEFLVWCRDAKKNSTDWLARQKRYLAWWADQLKGVDLRRATLVEHIKPALNKAKNRPHRIAVIKALYSWLRKEKHLLAIDEDPTFQALPVPAAKPEQWSKDKVIPKKDYRKVRKHVAQHWCDGMDVQAATGWHVTEVVRFAKTGSIEKHASDASLRVLVCPQAKSGEPLRTPVVPAAADAAQRLLDRGVFGREKYGLAIMAGCEEAGVEPFTAGRFRHSVATWAINNGADPALVSSFLGHKSPRTTKRFYATHAVPSKIPTLL